MRALAAERLSYVAVLEMQARRRPVGDAPWRDPRQGQGRALALLKMTPEITQRELTYLLGLSRQASAELLNKLERQGLIAREPSTDDRRVVIVRLTDEGRSADQMTGGVTGTGELLDCLDDDEVATFCDFLGRVIEQLEAMLGDEYVNRRDRLWEMAGQGFEDDGPRPPEPRPGRRPGGWFPGAPVPPPVGPPLPPHLRGPLPPHLRGAFPPPPPGPHRGPVPPDWAGSPDGYGPDDGWLDSSGSDPWPRP